MNNLKRLGSPAAALVAALGAAPNVEAKPSEALKSPTDIFYQCLDTKKKAQKAIVGKAEKALYEAATVADVSYRLPNTLSVEDLQKCEKEKDNEALVKCVVDFVPVRREGKYDGSLGTRGAGMPMPSATLGIGGLGIAGINPSMKSTPRPTAEEVIKECQDELSEKLSILKSLQNIIKRLTLIGDKNEAAYERDLSSLAEKQEKLDAQLSEAIK